VYDANKTSLPQQAKDFLPKLRKITVIGVESITTTLSVGLFNEPTPEDVSFEETDDKFTAFFSRTSGISGKYIDLHICKELERLLEVDMMMLFTCITHNAEDIRELFRFRGIEEIPDDNDVDGSWLQAMLHPNEPVVPAPVAVVVQNELPPSPISPPPPLPPPSPPLSVHDAGQFPPLGARGPKTPRRRADTQSSQYSASPANGHGNGSGRQRHRSVQSSVGVSEHSQFLQRSRSPFNANALAGQVQGFLQPTAPVAVAMGAARDVARLAAQAQAFANGNQMVPGAPGNPVWPPFGNFNVPPTATGDTDLVGVMGEHYVHSVSLQPTEMRQVLIRIVLQVYKMLIRMLDDFGPNNWTSELRHYIPGFAPFHGMAYADFTYDDTRGQLTREWFGPEKAAAWQGRWPRYHIEVKSTRGEENEPFHMSRVQMITVRPVRSVINDDDG